MPLLLALLLALPLVQAAAPNHAAACSIQYDGLPNGGYSITGSGVQPNEEVAVSIETPFDTYGTEYTTSQPDGTFVVYGYVYGNPGTYSASVTLHRYDKPVATCSAVL